MAHGKASKDTHVDYVVCVSVSKAASKTVLSNGSVTNEVNDNVAGKKNNVPDGIMRLDESGDEVWL